MIPVLDETTTGEKKKKKKRKCNKRLREYPSSNHFKCAQQQDKGSYPTAQAVHVVGTDASMSIDLHILLKESVRLENLEFATCRFHYRSAIFQLYKDISHYWRKKKHICIGMT